MNRIWTPDRREVIKKLSIGSAAIMGTGFFTSPGLYAEELTKTPTLTEGPFYPDKLPLDTDNDLLLINESITPAVGQITHLGGKVMDVKGNPIRNAFVEIWQVDNNGSYLHKDSDNRDKWDKHFQGYGRFLTDAKGQYYFRTIKPVAYTGRTPHIHIGVSRNGRRVFTSQILIRGEQQNQRDGVFRQIRDRKLRDLIAVDFKAIKGSKIGELQAEFDIVIGVTPEEENGKIKGGIGKRQWR